MLRTLLFASTLLSALPSPAHAQGVRVFGRVTDRASGAPIPDVAVQLGTAVTRTDLNGHFEFRNVAPGVTWLGAVAFGYLERRDTISVEPGRERQLDLVLDVAPIEVDGLRVETDGTLHPWLVVNGFAGRRAGGRGVLHRTREELRVQSGRNLADILERLDGVRVDRSLDGGSRLLLDPNPRGDGSPCEVGIYLNGSSVELGEFSWTGVRHTQRAMRPLRFDDLLRLDEIDGVELYGPADSPVASTSDCGALLLWSVDLRQNLDEPFVGAMSGTVADEVTGAPIGGVRVTIESSPLATTTDGAGRFEFPDLPPGEYPVRVDVADGTWRTRVEVKAFATTRVDVRVRN